MIPSVGEYVGGIKLLVKRLEGGLELVPKSGVEVGIWPSNMRSPVGG